MTDMTNRSNLFRDADSRARMSEARTHSTTLPTRRQRTPLARNLRRLGWRTTKATSR
jgi:hypothetical protein